MTNSKKRIAYDILGFEEREKTINSKKKGDKNELVLAKMLSTWTGMKFQRVPRSGGARWDNAINLIGDVTPSDITFNFPFVVETKHYKSIELKPAIRKVSAIYRFWSQVLDDSKRASKIPILFVRINDMGHRYKVFVSVSTSTVFESLGAEVKHIAINEQYHLKGFDSEDIMKLTYSEVDYLLNI